MFDNCPLTSTLDGRLKKTELERILHLLRALGFSLTHPAMEVTYGRRLLLNGLTEFREHLGGRLTTMLLKTIGAGEEVHEMDTERIKKASGWLQQYCSAEQKHMV